MKATAYLVEIDRVDCSGDIVSTVREVYLSRNDAHERARGFDVYNYSKMRYDFYKRNSGKVTPLYPAKGKTK